MDFLRQSINSVFNKVFGVQKKDAEVKTSRLDAYLNYGYKIVLWEDPGLSWIVLVGVHVLFW